MNIRFAGVLALALLASAPSLANDISNATWSETAASNVAAPPNGWPSGVVTPSQVSPMMRETMAALKRWYNHSNAVKTSAGTANVQTLTYDVAPAAYVTGDKYAFIVGATLTNTGATTLNVNALGAKAVKSGASALSGGEIVAGTVAVVYYDGTAFQLASGGGGGGGACADLSDDGEGCSAAVRAANLVLAGPATGAAAAPTFRALVNADLSGIMACAGLSDDGTACTANTGTSGTTLPFLDGTNTWSGLQTFGPVNGSIGNGGSPVSGTTYTFLAADCGKMVVFTSGSAVTATIPAAIVPATTACHFGVLQAGTAKVSVNGSAVSPATLISEHSFTGTSGTAGSMVGLTLLTVSAATRAYLTGSGS